MTDLELQSQETEALLNRNERTKQRALAIHIVALCAAAALAGAALASRAAHGGRPRLGATTRRLRRNPYPAPPRIPSRPHE